LSKKDKPVKGIEQHKRLLREKSRNVKKANANDFKKQK
jgi:hypothetical protein